MHLRFVRLSPWVAERGVLFAPSDALLGLCLFDLQGNTGMNLGRCTLPLTLLVIDIHGPSVAGVNSSPLPPSKYSCLAAGESTEKDQSRIITRPQACGELVLQMQINKTSHFLWPVISELVQQSVGPLSR